MNIQDKIVEIISEEGFYEKYANVEPEVIFKDIQEKVPEATIDDIGKVMAYMSTQVNGDTDLSEEALDDVAGGFAITITAATIGTAITVAKACAGAGAVIGAAYWYYKNRKK